MLTTINKLKTYNPNNKINQPTYKIKTQQNPQIKICTKVTTTSNRLTNNCHKHSANQINPSNKTQTLNSNDTSQQNSKTLKPKLTQKATKQNN